MIHSDRIQQLMEREGLSQSELARRVGVTQGAIAKIARNYPNGTSHLHTIARILGTSPGYLVGDTDDPDENAPPRPPAPRIGVLMEVTFPPEQALAAMFEGLLAGIDREAPVAEQALLLAQRLPIGISQLRDLRLSPATNRRPGREAATKALSMHDREPQP